MLSPPLALRTDPRNLRSAANSPPLSSREATEIFQLPLSVETGSPAISGAFHLGGTWQVV